MPGYELLDKKEFSQISDVFLKVKLYFEWVLKIERSIFKVKEFETNFAKKLKSKHALAVTSCTAALRVALATLDLNKGDEVITQSFTFVATVEAIVESGATPIALTLMKT